MFKAVDLSKLVTFFAIFHNDKPVDWLLDHMIQTKVCRFDRDTVSAFYSNIKHILHVYQNMFWSTIPQNDLFFSTFSNEIVSKTKLAVFNFKISSR